MSRFDFMMELNGLLSDIPLEEKQEAIQYYNGYFEDAGEEHEDEIIKELGSPQRIAQIIKANLSCNSEDQENRGYFTEKGFEDTIYKDPKYEIIDAEYKDVHEKDERKGNQQSNREENYNKQYTNQEKQAQNNYNKNTRTVLIILLCIFAIPVGIPLFFSVFGVLTGFVAVCLGILIAFGISGVAMSGAGVVLFFAGIVKLFGFPLMGLVLCGTGLLLFGIGMLFLLLSAIICKTVIPVAVRGVVNLCRLPFKNRSVTA